MNLNYISIFISVVLLAFLYFLKIRKISFGNRVFIAMILGVIVGVYLPNANNIVFASSIGSIYVSFIKMLVIPLVIATIVSSISSLDSPSKLKKVGLKTLFWLIATTVAACIIGLVVGLIINPGEGIVAVNDSGFKAREIPTFTKVLLDMVPSNPVNEMANGKIIPVIIFAILIGVAITIEGSKKPETVKPVKDFFNSFSQIMFRITKIVLKITPYGVYGLMVAVAAKYGLSALIPLGKMIFAVYIACAIQILIVHGSLITFIAKLNPIKFIKNIFPAQVVAFTTRSSYGTLPVTIKSLTHRVGVSDKIASFVAPMGATMGMNACGGLYPVISAIFVSKAFNVPLLPQQYIILILVTTIASFGTAGVPGTASIMTTVVLSAMGLPVEGIGMLLGVDTIIDMARTATNVTGASVAATLVASSEGELNRETFYSEENSKLELNI